MSSSSVADIAVQGTAALHTDTPLSAGEHTPGPWHVAPSYRQNSRGPSLELLVYDRNGCHVISKRGLACPSSPWGQANARLIAAAPDLLFALKMAVQRIERPELSPDANVVLERAHAAIAKATGGADVAGSAEGIAAGQLRDDHMNTDSRTPHD